MHRSLNPGEPLPDIDPVIQRYTLYYYMNIFCQPLSDQKLDLSVVLYVFSSFQQPHDVKVQAAPHLEKLKVVSYSPVVCN